MSAHVNSLYRCVFIFAPNKCIVKSAKMNVTWTFPLITLVYIYRRIPCKVSSYSMLYKLCMWEGDTTERQAWITARFMYKYCVYNTSLSRSLFRFPSRDAIFRLNEIFALHLFLWYKKIPLLLIRNHTEYCKIFNSFFRESPIWDYQYKSWI